jgi:uncharacterized protein (UPF0335 family)
MVGSKHLREIERVEGERHLVNQKKRQIINELNQSVVDKINIKDLVTKTFRKSQTN